MIGCGIDAGSRTMKVVLMEAADGRLIASGHADQIPDQARLADELLEETLTRAGAAPADIGWTVGTGYGRRLLARADTTVTEITCQARGLRSLVPEVRSIVDIGGQDSKVIFLDDRGVRDFAMNDRCAAGTGQYLEMTARRLGLSLPEMGHLASFSRRPAVISSMCAVFAESEIVSLLASGAATEDIAAGVFLSIAKRIAALAGLRTEPPVIFTGGAALIPGISVFLAEALGRTLTIAPDPLMTAARGAALIACERMPNPGTVDSAP
jgi:predicted CoA-substrate-specific enzyme activase